jgi:hypothetical protein
MHLQRNGMGDLVDGNYPLPQNPLWPQYNPAGPSNNSLSNPILNAAKNAIVSGKAKGVGDLVSGGYPVPQNPILSAVSSAQMPKAMMCDTSNALASSVASMQTGPTASLSGFELSTMANAMGLGQDLSTDFTNITGSVSDLMSGTTFGLSNWIVYGGGALAMYMLFANKKAAGTSRYHRAKKAVASF